MPQRKISVAAIPKRPILRGSDQDEKMKASKLTPENISLR
jgi:hypothetical protein